MGSDVYGSLVFGEAEQQKRLPEGRVSGTAEDGGVVRPLDPSVADAVAKAVKEWAMETWRHPLHPLVPAAHRHYRREARLVSRARTGDGRVVAEFSGKELIKGEPDASSFPSGGLALHVRSARLHRLGSDQPAVAADERQRGDARHPDRVRRRGPAKRSTRRRRCSARWRRCRSRPSACSSCSARRRETVITTVRPRAGILPDRPRVLLDSGPTSLTPRPHPLRRHAAEGSGTRRPVLSAPIPERVMAYMSECETELLSRSACR